MGAKLPVVRFIKFTAFFSPSSMLCIKRGHYEASDDGAILQLASSLDVLFCDLVLFGS